MAPHIPTSEKPAPDFSQLPFLLRLMDDASPLVRERVASRLSEMGKDIWRHIENENISLTPAQRHGLREILARGGNSSLSVEWPQWLNLRGENQKLEAAYAWLCSRQWGEGGDLKMRSALDELAREYLERGGVSDPEELGVYLFEERGLRGADGEEYYDPRNSDLLYVIKAGRGLPISLASVFMLVGWRLDIVIHGCNFPGHFLARAPLDGLDSSHDLVFDCFNGGRILSHEEVAALQKAAPRELSTPAPASAIIARVLRNLANAYHQSEDEQRTREVLDMLAQLEAVLAQSQNETEM